LALFRPAMTTAAPAEAKPFAMPSPMPPFPPVMNATLFCKSKIVIAGFLRIQYRDRDCLHVSCLSKKRPCRGKLKALSAKLVMRRRGPPAQNAARQRIVIDKRRLADNPFGQ
jgi:hypothetical protein